MRFSSIISICLMAIGIAAAAPISSQPFVVTTPDVMTQCAPSTITWTATHGPYYVQVLETSQEATFSGTQEMFMVPSNTATWIVDSPVGDRVRILIRDASGQIAESRVRMVQEGTKGCLGLEMAA